MNPLNQNVSIKRKKERKKEKKKEKKYGKITQISASLTFIALPMEHRYLLKRTT